VHGIDAAVDTAHRVGLTAPVAPWTGPSGREAVVQLPGDVTVQLYEQFDMSGFPRLATTPENRVYLTEDAVGAFLESSLKFTGGKVTSDVRNADGGEIGAPGTTYRRIRLTSPFGNTLVSVSNTGNWNYPYGKEPPRSALAPWRSSWPMCPSSRRSPSRSWSAGLPGSLRCRS